jgi:hypothetical protein
VDPFVIFKIKQFEEPCLLIDDDWRHAFYAKPNARPGSK